MPAKDTTEIKDKILDFLKTNGPSLPVQISRHISMDSIFASAFLSELLSEQKLKISSMKVGGSPLYYVNGTEEKLEKYSEYLKSKEKEAYELLKEKKFLKDKNQETAIRVALRSIKDFAKPFEYKENLIWRYFLKNKEEYYEKEEPKKKEEIKLSEPIVKIAPEKLEEKEIGRKEINPIQTDTKKEIERIIPKEEHIFQNPLAKKEEPKKKEKPKSDFVIKVLEFLKNQNWTVIKEISHKQKECNCLVKINSDLGPIIFYTNAKDKKSVTENDLNKVLREAQAIPLPAFHLSTGEPNKKAIETLEKFNSVLKYKKIH